MDIKDIISFFMHEFFKVNDYFLSLFWFAKHDNDIAWPTKKKRIFVVNVEFFFCPPSNDHQKNKESIFSVEKFEFLLVLKCLHKKILQVHEMQNTQVFFAKDKYCKNAQIFHFWDEKIIMASRVLSHDVLKKNLKNIIKKEKLLWIGKSCCFCWKKFSILKKLWGSWELRTQDEPLLMINKGKKWLDTNLLWEKKSLMPRS